MNPINHLDRYPGGVLRGDNAQDGGYALWTPHRGFQLEVVGGIEDSATQQYVVMRSPLYGDHMYSNDARLGSFGRYGELLNMTARSAVFERACDVSQLTKLESSSTIPNAQDFYRSQTFELVHVYQRVISEAKELRLTENQIYEQVVNQLWEDLLHYLTAHGLEIHFQGWSSQQTLSTTMASMIIHSAAPEMVANGFMRSLNKTSGTLDIRKPMDCVSSAPRADGIPGLDFDKFHYTMSELALWFSDVDDPEIHDMILKASSPSSVDVDADGYLYFKDLDVALFFAKAYLLLTTEHWNDTMQRLQIFAINQAFSLAVVRRILNSMKDEDGAPIDGGVTHNPQSYAYGIDSDLDEALKVMVSEGDEYANVLQEMIKTVGMQERTRMVNNKRRVYANFLKDRHAKEYPSSNFHNGKRDGHNRDFGPPSPMFEVNTHKTRAADNPRGLLPRLTDRSSQFTLDTLKVRSIDPLVLAPNGELKRLSEVSLCYRAILTEHAIVHKTSVNVKLMLSSDYVKIMRAGYEETTKQFDDLMLRDNISSDRLRRLVFASANRACVIAAERGVLVRS